MIEKTKTNFPQQGVSRCHRIRTLEPCSQSQGRPLASASPPGALISARDLLYRHMGAQQLRNGDGIKELSPETLVTMNTLAKWRGVRTVGSF